MLILNRRNLLKLERVVDKKHTWIVLEDYPVEFVDYPKIVHRFEIPAGFIFDFASVPRFAQGFYPKAGMLTDVPALIHDWLYATKIVDRKTADKLFYDAMLNLGVRKSKAWIMYRAVRLGGIVPWDGISKDKVTKWRKLGGIN